MVMTPEQLKRMVFPGESGGDYNALFGYANRPGGQFAGVNLTDMTVDQALEFANPRGPYGQSVKSQIGRVATPMGAYQIVGTTLRAAKEGLGLTGSERMTPELQDRLGMWIYQNQGPGAWEAWGRSGGGGSGSASSARGGAMPMGLFDMQDEPQTFGERLKRDWQSGDFMDRLALAANSLRANPDQNIAQMIQARQEQRSEQQTANRTAQWLASQGRDDLAQALMTGALDAKTAVATALTPAADTRTAMIQNYEYWLSQGKTPEEAQALARAGAGGTTIDMGGGGKFEEQFAKLDADTIASVQAAGSAAIRSAAKLQQLEEFLAASPGGLEAGITLMAGELGINTEGLDQIQAAQAIINSLVPEQRQEGSGPMSDADLALFKQSLPRIMNQPGGNALILNTLKAIAAYDAAGLAIVQRLRNGEIDRPTAFQLLMERPHPIPQFRAEPGGDGGGGGTTLSPGAEALIE